MFKMKKRSYRVFEGLRVATLVSYIGALLMPILTILKTNDSQVFRQGIFSI